MLPGCARFIHNVKVMHFSHLFGSEGFILFPISESSSLFVKNLSFFKVKFGESDVLTSLTPVFGQEDSNCTQQK